MINDIFSILFRYHWDAEVIDPRILISCNWKIEFIENFFYQSFHETRVFVRMKLRAASNDIEEVLKDESWECSVIDPSSMLNNMYADRYC